MGALRPCIGNFMLDIDLQHVDGSLLPGGWPQPVRPWAAGTPSGLPVNATLPICGPSFVNLSKLRVPSATRWTLKRVARSPEITATSHAEWLYLIVALSQIGYLPAQPWGTAFRPPALLTHQLAQSSIRWTMDAID